MIRAVLFDLDGTLLPLNQEEFVKIYMRSLAAKMAEHGYEPTEFVNFMWHSVAKMVANDGARANEDVFAECFNNTFGIERYDGCSYIMKKYYSEDFERVSSVCGKNPLAYECVNMLKSRGVTVALATNPLFPWVATHARVRWAGLRPEDFSLITTIENSHFCKPSLDYYIEIFKKLGVTADECIMVGNDVSEDMVAEKLGCSVFLLTDNLINKNNENISLYANGNFDDLLAYLDSKTR